ARRMDRMYRHQRHIYDLTRRYYLLGRNRLLDEIPVEAGDTLLEIGCGTGRNLVRLARRHPELIMVGIDASAAMLGSAREAAARAGLAHRIRLGFGIGEQADAGLAGHPAGFRHVVFSYALSMFDEPVAALDRAIALLAPGGILHVVDFGDAAALPRWFQQGLVAWLDRFGVRHRPEVAHHLRTLAAADRGRFEHRPLAGRYAEIMRFWPANA
ncbi:class I SAM-dependent methyltransferase, partial [Geminicoccus flavidas]|uniref:class I SAM-dependent methyltransferase n=1 Tax=Geminicoccus flavidas TaxID=2506407 RepID=UPI001F2BDE05